MGSDNKLGPALFLAVGIALLYLVATGKVATFIAYLQGNSQGKKSSPGGSTTATAGTTGQPLVTSAAGATTQPNVTGTDVLSGQPYSQASVDGSTSAFGSASSLTGVAANSTGAIGEAAAMGASPVTDVPIAYGNQASIAFLGVPLSLEESNQPMVTTGGAIGYNAMEMAHA